MEYKKEIENLVKNVDFDPEAVKLYINSCQYDEIKRMMEMMEKCEISSSEILRILMCSPRTLEDASTYCIELIRKGIIPDKDAIHCVTEMRLGFVRYWQETSSDNTASLTTKYTVFCNIMRLISRPLSMDQQTIPTTRSLEVLPTVFELSYRTCSENSNPLEVPQQVLQQLLDIHWNAETISSLISLFIDIKPFLTETHEKLLQSKIKECVKTAKSNDFVSIFRCCLDLVNRFNKLDWIHLARWLLRNTPKDMEATVAYFLDLSIKQSSGLGLLILKAIEESTKKGDLHWQDVRLLSDLLRNDSPLLPTIGNMYHPTTVSKSKIIQAIEITLFHACTSNFDEEASSSQLNLTKPEMMAKVIERVLLCHTNDGATAQRAQSIVELAFQWCKGNQSKVKSFASRSEDFLTEEETIEIGILAILLVYKEIPQSRATVLSMVLNGISHYELAKCKDGLCKLIDVLTTTQLSALVEHVYRIQDWISFACLQSSPYVTKAIVSFLPLARLCSGFFDFLLITMRKLLIRRDEESQSSAIHVLCMLLRLNLAKSASHQEDVASCLQDALCLPFALRANMYQQLGETFHQLKLSSTARIHESTQAVFRSSFGLRILRFFAIEALDEGELNKKSQKKSKSVYRDSTEGDYTIEIANCFDFGSRNLNSSNPLLREPLNELICCTISLERLSTTNSSSVHQLAHCIVKSLRNLFNKVDSLMNLLLPSTTTLSQSSLMDDDDYPTTQESYTKDKESSTKDKESSMKDKESSMKDKEIIELSSRHRLYVARLLCTCITNCSLPLGSQEENKEESNQEENKKESNQEENSQEENVNDDIIYFFEICTTLKQLEGVEGISSTHYPSPVHSMKSLMHMLHLCATKLISFGISKNQSGMCSPSSCDTAFSPSCDTAFSPSCDTSFSPSCDTSLPSSGDTKIPTIDSTIYILENLRSKEMSDLSPSELKCVLSDVKSIYDCLDQYWKYLSQTNLLQNPRYLALYSKLPTSWQDAIERDRIFPTERKAADKRLRLHLLLLHLIGDMISNCLFKLGQKETVLLIQSSFSSSFSSLENKGRGKRKEGNGEGKGTRVEECGELTSCGQKQAYQVCIHREEDQKQAYPIFTSLSWYFSKKFEKLIQQGISMKLAIGYVDLVTKLVDYGFTYENQKENIHEKEDCKISDLPQLLYSIICLHNIQQPTLLRNLVKLVLDPRAYDLGCQIMRFAFTFLRACFIIDDDDDIWESNKKRKHKKRNKKLEKAYPVSSSEEEEEENVMEDANHEQYREHAELVVDSDAVCSVILISVFNFYEEIASKVRVKGTIFALDEVLEQFQFLLQKDRVQQISSFSAPCRAKLASVFEKYFKIYREFIVSLRKSFKLNAEILVALSENTIILFKNLAKLAKKVQFWAIHERQYVAETTLRRKLAAVLFRVDVLRIDLTQFLLVLSHSFPKQPVFLEISNSLNLWKNGASNSPMQKKALHRIEHVRKIAHRSKKRLRSRNEYIDECLAHEDGDDAFVDLEDFIVA